MHHLEDLQRYWTIGHITLQEKEKKLDVALETILNTSYMTVNQNIVNRGLILEMKTE